MRQILERDETTNKKHAVKQLFDYLQEIPTDFVQPLYELNQVEEVTPIRQWSFVRPYEPYGVDKLMEVIEVLPNNRFLVEVTSEDTTRLETYSTEDIRVVFPEDLPDFETMWRFHNPNLSNWLEWEGNLAKVADCGFRIYQHKKLGYIIGTSHDDHENIAICFELLYDAIDLNWHLDATLERTLDDDLIVDYFETREVIEKALHDLPIHELKNEIARLKAECLSEIPNDYIAEHEAPELGKLKTDKRRMAFGALVEGIKTDVKNHTQSVTLKDRLDGIKTNNPTQPHDKPKQEKTQTMRR